MDEDVERVGLAVELNIAAWHRLVDGGEERLTPKQRRDLRQ
jgi:hypothetical protein